MAKRGVHGTIGRKRACDYYYYGSYWDTGGCSVRARDVFPINLPPSGCNICNSLSQPLFGGVRDAVAFTFALARPSHGTQASEAGALTFARTRV